MLTSTASLPLAAAATRASSSTGPVKRTDLNAYHRSIGGKMVPFAGWDMPVQYKDGVIKEVERCRTAAALFDVAHMGQLRIYGKDRIPFIESLTVADIKNLPENSIRYSLYPNENGGTIDDTMITKCKDHLYIVVNAGCYDKDMAHIMKHARNFKDLQIENLYESNALIAIQGPTAEASMKKIVEPEVAKILENMPFMTRTIQRLAGIDNCIISRSGYTGEDGYEISIPKKHIQKFVDAICAVPGVGWAGLGARDTLRLEAALSLYGHDLDDKTTLVEAGLTWALDKRRRQEGGFLGADTILKQLKNGVQKKRVGMVIQGAPAREQATVHDLNGKQIGIVTSGGPAPTIQKNIAIATVPTEKSKVGTMLLVNVRNKLQPAEIVNTPFFPHRFKK